MKPIFTPKKIISDQKTGAKLKTARAFKGLTLEEVSKITKIKARYLEALEEDDYGTLPDGLYSASYLKKYALFLDLDPENLDKEIKNGESEKSYNQQNPFTKTIVKKHKLIIFPKIIRNILIGLAIVACLLYLGLYIKKIFFPPFLIVSQPAKNMVSESNVLEVIGQTEVEAEVRINSELVLNNKNGEFSQIIILKKGLNNIIITAQKKYSRTKTVTRQILIP